MKIPCNVCVHNRLATSTQKYLKSTLALCKHPKNPTYYIILFNVQNKLGTRYEVKDNVTKVFTRCLNEGKSTIQFKQPQHDLLIRADPIQLKGFLHLFKRALENKISERENTCSSLSVMPFSSNIVPTKMCIRKRSDYPTRGFPRTLEILHINDIERCGLDGGILNLPRLKVLDLSYNCIEFLPTELNKLPCLSDLNVANNMLGKGPPSKWNWLGGNFSKTLKALNLSSNNLRYLPDNIIKLHKLITLRIDDNNLKNLPSGIGNLSNLQIFSASKNSLSCLPGSTTKLNLDYLDLSENKFCGRDNSTQAVTNMKFPLVATLKELASRVVLFMKFPYNEQVVPATIVRYLDHAKYCVCGKACFDTFLISKSTLLLGMISKAVKLSNNVGLRVPIDIYFCSVKCIVGFKDMRG